MGNYDTATEKEIEFEALFFEYFNGAQESISGGEEQIVEFDHQSSKNERTIGTGQVVDCVVIPIWGKTAEGKSFVSLVHKGNLDEIKDIFGNDLNKLIGAKLSYLVIPGAETGETMLNIAKSECLQLFGDHEPADTIPKVKIIGQSNVDKSHVAIRGNVDQQPEILIVRPKIALKVS